MEHICDVMERQLIAQTRPCPNTSTLRDHCLDIWYNLSPVMYQKLVAPIPRTEKCCPAGCRQPPDHLFTCVLIVLIIHVIDKSRSLLQGNEVIRPYCEEADFILVRLGSGIW
ncbi:hypothetical protein AVEN_236014-1 [Araneus ventricosus]|uniref:Uncharacterized protein n=1 Tax=Araneus ventricosus TaxID=182803 RepID=A0A4Y2MHC1_ARAVE|nr:hypothetical protein AVEN_236014-1 [Araneus ventricosus]